MITTTFATIPTTNDTPVITPMITPKPTVPMASSTTTYSLSNFESDIVSSSVPPTITASASATVFSVDPSPSSAFLYCFVIVYQFPTGEYYNYNYNCVRKHNKLQQQFGLYYNDTPSESSSTTEDTTEDPMSQSSAREGDL